MRINYQTNNLACKGYKNLICDMYEDNAQSKFAFMTVQLTDEGEKDLNKWKEIQKNLLHKKESKDTITFQMIQTPRGSNLYLANVPLDMRLYKDMPECEPIALKAFTLIASLTKRIMEYSMTFADSDMPKVLLNAREDIGKFLFQSRDKVDEIIYNSHFKNISDHKIAGTINKTIQKKMISYFK